MRLSIVQSSLQWENPEANRQMFAEKLRKLRGETDLVMLPEMWTTGFSMNAERLAEPMDGPTMAWLSDMASELDAAMVGSFICADQGRFFNRLVFMCPDGQFHFYDKKHLFSLATEHEHFTPGKKRILVEWRGWQICPLICYDLRFPVWSRNTPGNFVQGLTPYYDLLIYVANWPSRRAHHWRSLLTARAIENQAFVAGANIAGTDGIGLEYSGDSSVVDYAGHALGQLPDGKEGILTLTLSKQALQEYRQQFPFLSDADRFDFQG